MAWTTVSFNQNGGSGGQTRTLYLNYTTSGSSYKINYFASAQSTSTSYRVTSVTVPTKSSNVFIGYGTTATGGTTLFSSTGAVSCIGDYLSSLPSAAYAHWQNYTKVTINANGGSGGTGIVYRSIADGKIYGDTGLTGEITKITVPKKYGYNFNGATYNSTQVIDADGNFTEAFYAMSISTASITAVSQWVASTESFGDVHDWFGLASSTLQLISSDSGDNKKRECVMNATWSTGGTPAQDGGAGKYDTSVNEASGVWRNPTVTYQVIGDMTLAVTLGKGYAAVNSGTSAPTISGYMITGVQIQTAIGKFPTVTITGTANEGYTRSGNNAASYTAKATDAINTFALSVPLLGRARAQNLLNAVTNGGQLQSCNLQASCSPVVLAENMMPCASDITGGRLSVDAMTYAPAREAAPTAGNGFTLVGAPEQCGGTNYLAWAFKAEKEMN